MTTDPSSAAALTPAEQDAAFRPDHTPVLPWSELVAALDRQGQLRQVQHLPTGPEAAGPTGITLDSRTVSPGDLYVALPGAQRHGAEFAADVVASGGIGILTDAAGARMLDAAQVQVPVIVVEQVREVLGTAAAAVHRSTGAGPELYGVTGTNGKTTTTYFLTALLGALEETTGLIGTIEIRAGDRRVPSTLTTPEAPQLHALMALMRQEGVGAAAMEVSSHAISYQRVAGLRFTVAGFTNLSQDHLDLHGSMDEYFQAKAGLFEAGRAERAVITLNGGSETSWGQRMAQAATCPVVTLDLGPAAEAATGAQTEADWAVRDVTPEGMGHRFTLHHPASGRTVRASTGLPGRFNVANAALAAVMVLEGRPQETDRIAAILDVPAGEGPLGAAVPGRMEVISRRPDAVVDFAHNPDGMVRALESVRDARLARGQEQGRTILLFGATGDRDVTKRPIMAQIAVDGADVVIITDDTPHSEDPQAIREAVMAAAEHAAAQAAAQGRTVQCHLVAPRAAAIDLAVELAEEQDTILLAGRGHETYQDFDGVHVPLDDRTELREALRRRGIEPLTGSSPAAR